MKHEIDWEKIADCPSDRKKKLIPYIEQLIELKHNFEENGIYGFCGYLKSNADMFEKVALTLIMQGYMPEMCRTILYNLLSASNFNNYEYLKNVVFAEFVLILQEKETSDQYIKMILLSYLGIDCAEELLPYREEYPD